MNDEKIKIIADALEEQGVPAKEIEETVEALKMKEKLEKEKKEQKERDAEALELVRQRDEAARTELVAGLLTLAIEEYKEKMKEWNRPVNRLKRFFDF